MSQVKLEDRRREKLTQFFSSQCPLENKKTSMRRSAGSKSVEWTPLFWTHIRFSSWPFSTWEDLVSRGICFCPPTEYPLVYWTPIDPKKGPEASQRRWDLTVRSMPYFRWDRVSNFATCLRWPTKMNGSFISAVQRVILYRTYWSTGKVPTDAYTRHILYYIYRDTYVNSRLLDLSFVWNIYGLYPVFTLMFILGFGIMGISLQWDNLFVMVNWQPLICTMYPLHGGSVQEWSQDVLTPRWFISI